MSDKLDSTREATMWWGTQGWTEEQKKAYEARLLAEKGKKK